MRVLHVIHSLDPALGGPQVVASRLAAGQAGLGHRVTLATYDEPARRQLIDAAFSSAPSSERIELRRLAPPNGILDRLIARGAVGELERLVADSDLVHLHSVWQPLLVAAGRVCRRRDRPYVVTLHGNLDPWALSQRRLKKRLALALAFRAHLEGAAALHVLNADEQRLIEPLGLSTPSFILPNGIFLEEIEPRPEPGGFHRLQPRLDGRRFVLFLSRLHYKKGLDYLADAFGRVADLHPEVDLVVAGPDGGDRGHFESEISRRALSGRVHLVGPIYGPDKLAALVDADCFCLPSRQEGFSIAITEALACATPVVITEGCHFPEVAEVGAGEVVPLSGEAVGAALDNVLRDAEARRRMGRAGRRLVECRYTWPVIAARSLEVYESIVAGAPLGG